MFVLLLTKAKMGEANKYFLQLIDTGLLHRSEHYVLRCVSLAHVYFYFFHGATAPSGPGLTIFEVSQPHSFRQTTLGRIPLDDSSAQTGTST